MKNILIVFLGVGILVFIVLLVFLSVARFTVGKSENDENIKRTPGSGKPLCPRCKTGKKTVGLDLQSEECPYLSSWKNGKCQHFVPMEKHLKK